MKTFNNIKAVLYNENSADGGITSRFLGLKHPEFIGYKDDNSLSLGIEKIRDKYKSKEVVILKPFKGRFLQLCPGSPDVTCCNYRVINTCFNCLYDCTYCFLNFYLNSFGIVQFTNIEDILGEIDLFTGSLDPAVMYRIGSGEFTDSLMMDEITGLGERLIKKLSRFRNVMLELKTKSDNISHLLNIREKGNTVLAWSLNTERNIARYERGTASLRNRILAAKKAADAGFFLAFHFDPIIIYDGWDKEYEDIIRDLFSYVNPERVAWISMGCFRYSPPFKDILRENFPDEELTLEEMFPGIDGKMRYLKNKRIDIYRTMMGYLDKYSGSPEGSSSVKPFIYLCMETPDVWHPVFNKYYETSEMLEMDFSEHLRKNFLI